jgi:hypothetical protein
MHQFKRINNEKVLPIPLIGGASDKRPIKGEQLFSEIFANIFLVARKKSGKTSVIYKIVKDCVDKHTTVVAFVSTLYKDDNWIAIRKYCTSHNIPFIGHTSLKEAGDDKLEALVDKLLKEAEENEIKKNEPKKKKVNILALDSDEEDEDHARKSKFRTPEYLIILDDLSNELKSNSLVALLKNNRHFKAKVIVSSQYLNDLLPESRQQLDYFLVFKGQPKEKLEVIYKDADIAAIPFNEFNKIYEIATREPYSFLYIDRHNQTYRKNFDMAII